MDIAPDPRPAAAKYGPPSPFARHGLDGPGAGTVLDCTDPVLQQDAPAPESAGVELVHDDSGGNVLGARLNDESLREAFQSLPDLWRQVLWQMDLNKVSVPEVARLLGLSPAGVKTLHRRATKGLREVLQEPANPRPGGLRRPL
ncbi:RNA polymerase sigma factor [Paenarthrobacter sp. NPDC056912]|uniref:RNA polymerase sigma factor n=1 Tax=Paenarthrobacter sp. NPDC056912 TaxID=3345965 RepID=UPI00366AAD56